MAGHSKWANIKFRKAAEDAKRGKVFTKLIREVTVAAREGGGDPKANPRLRQAIDKALASNMTKDNIERAVKRGTGELEGVAYEDVRYEGYAPGGVAVMAECSTDNRNRTAGEVRHAFAKHGGNLGTDGSVAFLFDRVGVLAFGAGADEERIVDVAAGAGAREVQSFADGTVEVLTEPDGFEAVREALLGAGIEPAEAGVTYRPMNEVEVHGTDAEQALRLLEALDDLDDVQDVYTNASFPDELANSSAA